MATTSTESGDNTLQVVLHVPKDLLLVIFVHGFKGTDSTFESFPSRLEHILRETMNNVIVECIVFPAYETKGELDAAVERFADWLTTLVVQKEVAHGGGAGTAKIVLCGHSMGGLLVADALWSFISSRPDEDAPLWPRIIGCLAFDSPYLGLHPYVFKNSVTKATELAGTARTIASDVLWLFGKSQSTSPKPPDPSLLQITAAGESSGGAVAAGAAAGAAYWRRDEITSGYKWAFDHMKYVGNLWDEAAMNKRLDNMMLAETKYRIVFKMFYLLLPPSAPVFPASRTFVVLPSRSSPVFANYIIARNSLTSDEIKAHMGMFDPTQNDGYYELGLETANIIRETARRNGMRSTVTTDPQPGTETTANQ
ncbi:hypothetical protein SCLCIDRAFT_899412 [Scleroderma citrinum Foug A]|uniref:DUF676 domain-containing protein n=1 Tax=Scleroderma citrinum Foug A TaxID=1036808 RepID=A0A0C3ELR1_9AGAM|nr:hypothetical protein SCLCIDRAFT_899412 [Scleroderma citrinum Foug A]